LLTGMNLNEAISYSFMAPAALDKLGLDVCDALRDTVRIMNPIGEEYSLMRTTMAPAMLRNIATNNNRKIVTVRLFELSRTFRPNHDSKPKNPDGSYSMSEPCIETEALCIGIADKDADFYSIKGIVEELLSRFGVEGVQFKQGAPCYYHPGRSAVAWLGDEQIAVLGEVHPDAAEAFEVGQKAYLAEIDVDKLLASARKDSAIKPLPKHPAISRDLAVSVGKLCPVGDMLAAIRKAGGALLEMVELFDVYEGKQAGEGKKSVAFSLVFRAADHTMVDDEANGCFDAIVQALNLAFSAEIRK
jgi:phenylalanyl-tRNA synthetase beta chain